MRLGNSTNSFNFPWRTSLVLTICLLGAVFLGIQLWTAAHTDIRGTREMIQIDQNDNGHEVSLALGEQVELSLAENQTTGFRWELKSQAEPVCELVQDRFELPDGKPGNGGVHRWEFRAVHPGSGEIQLEYRRPWEKNVAAAKTYKASIRVRE